jgi:predicted phosphodiesterase
LSLSTENPLDLPIPPSAVGKAFSELEKLIGSISLPTTPKARKKKERKILCISDLHFPFHDEALLAQALSDHSDADILMINGDVFDAYSLSSFQKEFNKNVMEEELALSRAFFVKVAGMFPEVIVDEGNHDARPRKIIQKHFPQLLPFLIDPLELLTQGLKNVSVARNYISGTQGFQSVTPEIRLDYYHQIGDAIFIHGDVFYQEGGKAAQDIYQFFVNWKNVLKLPKEPKLIVQAHTHRMARRELPDGVSVIESGCLCKPMAYMMRRPR